MIGVYVFSERHFWFGRDIDGYTIGPFEDGEGHARVLGALLCAFVESWMDAEHAGKAAS